MYYMRYFIICLFFLLCNLITKAESGCLIPNNIIYKQGTVLNILGAQVFERTGATATLSAGYCSWTPTSGVTCYVCNTLLITGVCLDTPTQGYRSANFNMVLCNLDDYTWALGAAAGFFGIFIIRKKNKL